MSHESQLFVNLNFKSLHFDKNMQWTNVCLLNKHLIFQFILSLSRFLFRLLSVGWRSEIRSWVECGSVFPAMSLKAESKSTHSFEYTKRENEEKKHTHTKNMYAITTKSGIKHLTGASDALSFSSNARLAQRFCIVTSKFHYIDIVSMARLPHIYTERERGSSSVLRETIPTERSAS